MSGQAALGDELHRVGRVSCKMSTDYSSGFVPAHYLENRWDLSKADTNAVYIKYKIAEFMARFYHDYHHHWDPQTAQVLEIGGGPAIGNEFAAGPYVSDITFTDYLIGNLEQVKLWKEKSPDAFNWDAAFQHVVKETRGEEVDVVALATEWQEQLRDKISTIVQCDVRKEGFIDPNLVPAGGFDVLITSGAFEYVALDKGSFSTMLKTCHSLLQQDGYMAVATYMKNNTYRTSPDADRTFSGLYLTEEIVREALTEAGFNLVQSELFKVNTIEFVPSECFCYVVKKI